LSGIYGVHPAGEGEETRSCFDWALKKQLFMHINQPLTSSQKNYKNRVKQRLFHGNTMRQKGTYFAQHERVSSRPTDFFRFIVEGLVKLILDNR
jgi:hypothetical protein